MLNRALFFLVVFCSIFSFSPLTQAQISSSAKYKGNISAVDIQYKTIQIGQVTYGLVDGIQVYSKNNHLLDQRALAPLQEVEFSLRSQPLAKEKNSNLPDQVVSYIRILSDIKEELKND